MKEVDDNYVEWLLDTFVSTGSIKATHAECGCSWNRVVKILSTYGPERGIYINETHENIMDLHEKGMTTKEIAKELSLSYKTVCAYLPATRSIYMLNRSENAKKIARYRERKNPKII